MDTRHFTLAAIFTTSLLVLAPARAQEAARARDSARAYQLSMTASQQPAKNRELIATLEGSAAAYQSRGSLTQAFSGEPKQQESGCTHCRGWLVEALLRWTDRLVTKLDPLGVVDTPFERAPEDLTRAPSSSPSDWKPIPRVRPVQLHGGYGLVARITF